MATEYTLSDKTVAKIADALRLEPLEFKSVLDLLERFPMSLYANVSLRKGRGKRRDILVPTEVLQNLQMAVHRICLKGVKHNRYCHGFVKSRSVITNAKSHTGSTLAVSLDFSDFFTSIKGDKVFNVFRRLCKGDEVAYVFTLICTVCESNVDPKNLSQRYLPQGTTTSPTLSNLCTSKFDYRVVSLLERKMSSWKYSRYVDDLSFSTADNKQDVGRLLNAVIKIASDEGLNLATHKTHVERDPEAILVTGILVNPSLHLSREYIRRLRAMAHNLGGSVNEGQERARKISGLLSFMASVNKNQFAEVIVKLKLHDNPLMSETPIIRHYWSNQNLSTFKYMQRKERMRLRRDIYRLETSSNYKSNEAVAELKHKLLQLKSQCCDEVELLIQKHKWLILLLDANSNVTQNDLGLPNRTIVMRKPLKGHALRSDLKRYKAIKNPVVATIYPTSAFFNDIMDEQGDV